MKRFISAILILAVSLSLVACGSKPFSENPDAIDAASKSVVEITVYDKSNTAIAGGSGFFAFDSKTIITNYHVQYDLEEDYLASHKTEIGSTVAHIAYSSTGWDKDLTDGRIAVKGTKTIYHDSQALGFDGGCTAYRTKWDRRWVCNF